MISLRFLTSLLEVACDGSKGLVTIAVRVLMIVWFGFAIGVGLAVQDVSAWMVGNVHCKRYYGECSALYSVSRSSGEVDAGILSTQ